MSDPAHFLLSHFDRLAEAPGGIIKLRALIYELASTGRLTEADSVQKEAKPLGTLAEFIMGQAPPGTDCNERGEGTLFVKVGEFGPLYPERRAWTTRPLKFAKEGDVLICVVGATVGKINLGVDCAIGRSVAAIRPSPVLRQKYLYNALMPFTLRLRADARGSAQGVIGKADLSAVLIWTPSLKQQDRVVAKVEELMGLCDALEAAQREREAVRTRLRTSALYQLASSDTDSKSVDFALQNLPRLTTEPEDLALLRQSIFQLAISGGLLARIDPWKTARLDSIAECRLGKMLDAQKNTGRPTKYLRNTNVHWFRFELDSIKELKLEAEEFAEYEVHPGDVMICEGGHGIGRTAVWRGEIQGIIFQKALHRVRPKKELHPDFFSYVMKVFYDTGVLSEFYTGAGIPHLTGQELKKIAIPLPPLAEQRRIVAKVEQLMALVDALETQLAASRATAESLLSAIVAELTAQE